MRRAPPSPLEPQGPEPPSPPQFLFLPDVLQWRAHTTPDHPLFLLLNAKVRLMERAQLVHRTQGADTAWLSGDPMTAFLGHGHKHCNLCPAAQKG